MRFFIALAFVAPLFAQPQPCPVIPNSFHFGAGTNFGTVHVPASCGPYIATTQTPWLQLNDPGGSPGHDVLFQADANQSAAPRSGTMSIANATVAVTQDGATCSFSIVPTTQTFPVSGGSNTFSVKATCPWQAATNVPWLTLSGTTGGSLNGTVGYSVTANTCVSARTGSIALQQTNLPNPPTLTLTQDGSPDNLTLSAYTATSGAPSSTGRITVTTGDVCTWSATTNETWIQITFGATGTGNGGISYRLLENTAAQRTGAIHVGALTYTITQQAPGRPAPVLSSVVNAAGYNADAVSPGEIVALFGTNLGPAPIVTLQVTNGTVTNSLGGTQVLFDGVAAPMVYSLAGQVSAVVPYAVSGKPSTQVQVQYQGAASNTVTIPVHAATPAIFSLDSTGVGPGAILNQDTSIDTTGNPAARLSVIALYCTGGGITKPASSDGAVIGDASFLLAQTPVVTIGGVNATVKYAGAAPGAVAGLTQINVEVPAGVTPGIALPVVVKIGDFSSTGSVTVAVK